MHLKIIRLFVESVLRYGLPAEYIGIVVEVSMSIVFSVQTDFQKKKQPEPKSIKKVFNILQTQFEYLSPKSNAAKGGKVTGDEFVGEYQTLMDQEFFNFVLYEVPWIIT